MTDYSTRLRERGIMPVAIERTQPKPGERFFVGHRTMVANDRGSYEPTPIAHPPAGPAVPLHTSAWPPTWQWALMGLILGVVMVWGICS